MSLTDLTATQTYRSTRGRVPIFRPQMGGVEFPITVQEASVFTAENEHDGAVMACTSTELTTTDGMLGSSIAFYWGQAPRTELFCGYIMDVKETEVGKGNISFTLTLLGATQPMQSGRPRFWTGKTVPSAVEGLSYISGLGFYGHPHSLVWDALSQTSESDWQSAANYASRLGWKIYNRYGVLLCYDSTKLLAEQGSFATLKSSQDQDTFDPTADRRLIEFSPTETSESTPQNYGYQLAYFTDRGDVQVTKERGEFEKYRFVSSLVVSSAEVADVYANAPSYMTERWNQSAEARLWGDSDLYPGLCVDVVTTNARYLRQKFDGRWLIRAAVHKMDVQQFQTQLLLGRPSSDAQITSAPYQPFWQLRGKARPTLSLQNDEWLSSWTDLRARSVL